MDTCKEMNVGNIFDSKEYANANAQFRWLDHTIFNKYYNQILLSLGRKPKDILDVGCGTGQFAINIAVKSPDSHVVALDSSFEQINTMKRLAEKKQINNITPVLQSIEEYTTDRKFDLIVCSEVIHLIDDLSAFANKLSKMLEDGGVIAIRTPSAEQIFNRTYYNFFPLCKYIDLLRCKSKELIKASFDLFGVFSAVSFEVDESKLVETEKIIQGTKMKQFSTLYLIPDEEFQKGLNSMKEYLSHIEMYCFDFKMMLYLLKKEEDDDDSEEEKT